MNQSEEVLVFIIHGLWLRAVVYRGIRADRRAAFRGSGEVVRGRSIVLLQLFMAALLLCILAIAGVAVK